MTALAIEDGELFETGLRNNRNDTLQGVCSKIRLADGRSFEVRAINGYNATRLCSTCRGMPI